MKQARAGFSSIEAIAAIAILSGVSVALMLGIHHLCDGCALVRRQAYALRILQHRTHSPVAASRTGLFPDHAPFSLQEDISTDAWGAQHFSRTLTWAHHDTLCSLTFHEIAYE